MDPKSLGLTLAALRKVAGLTQAQMAKRMKVSVSTYGRHESGREAPSARLIVAYGRELGHLHGEFWRVHEELHRGRRRVQQGPHWHRNQTEEALTGDRQDLEARKALHEFESNAVQLVERLRSQLKKP